MILDRSDVAISSDIVKAPLRVPDETYLLFGSSVLDIRSMDMDVLLLQFCSVAHENMQEQVFIRIAEEFNVLL